MNWVNHSCGSPPFTAWGMPLTCPHFYYAGDHVCEWPSLPKQAGA